MLAVEFSFHFHWQFPQSFTPGTAHKFACSEDAPHHLQCLLFFPHKWFAGSIFFFEIFIKSRVARLARSGSALSQRGSLARRWARCRG
jgi:hypothetical protein